METRLVWSENIGYLRKAGFKLWYLTKFKNLLKLRGLKVAAQLTFGVEEDLEKHPFK